MDTSSKCGHSHHHAVCLVPKSPPGVIQRRTRETEATVHRHQERLKVAWASFPVLTASVLKYEVYS